MSRKQLGEVMSELAATIENRRGDSPETSYTASLLQAGAAKCARKFGEEAVEAVLAGVGGDRAHLTAEAADVIYHLIVLLAVNNVTPEEVAAELARRQGQSGHEEKASRG